MHLIYTPLGYLLKFCYDILGPYANYGIALIVFTLIIKVITFPLSVKQHKSSIEMARIKPKLDALNKKYGNDKVKLQEETQKLYAQENYSPLSGCLPMLVQLPILFGLFGVIRYPLRYMLRIDKSLIDQASTKLQELIDSGVILAKKVSASDAEILTIKYFDKIKEVLPQLPNEIGELNLNFGFLDLAGNPSLGNFGALWLIPILAGLTALLSSWISQKTNPSSSGQGGMMNAMIYGMPLISLIFAFSLPAGIGFYWSVSNIFAIIQTLILYRFYNMHKINARKYASITAKRREYENEVKQRIAGGAKNTKT